jgi:hypothetical protein
MTDTRIMSEISQMPDVRRRWRTLTKEQKAAVLKQADGCADRACLLRAIKRARRTIKVLSEQRAGASFFKSN